MKKIKLRKRSKIKKILVAHFVLDQNLSITFFSINDFIAQITFSCSLWRCLLVQRFQNFSIKTLTRIACLNFKNKQKTGLNPLELRDNPNTKVDYEPQDVVLWVMLKFLF